MLYPPQTSLCGTAVYLLLNSFLMIVFSFFLKFWSFMELKLAYSTWMKEHDTESFQFDIAVSKYNPILKWFHWIVSNSVSTQDLCLQWDPEEFYRGNHKVRASCRTTSVLNKSLISTLYSHKRPAGEVSLLKNLLLSNTQEAHRPHAWEICMQKN